MSKHTRNQRKTNPDWSTQVAQIRVGFTIRYTKPMTDLMSAWTNQVLTVISEATIDSEMLVKPSKARLRYLKAGDNLVVSGLTQRDLYDCMIRGYIQSHLVYKDGTLEPLEPNATLSREASKGVYAQLNANDMFSLVGGVDPLAVIQNTLCEVEKLMGEFPMILTNLRLLEEKDCVHQTGPYSYICKSGKTIERRTLSEHNTSQYAWVLYKNNAEVDRDQSLEALAERNNLEITTY